MDSIHVNRPARRPIQFLHPNSGLFNGSLFWIEWQNCSSCNWNVNKKVSLAEYNVKYSWSCFSFGWHDIRDSEQEVWLFNGGIISITMTQGLILLRTWLFSLEFLFRFMFLDLLNILIDQCNCYKSCEFNNFSEIWSQYPFLGLCLLKKNEFLLERMMRKTLEIKVFLVQF